MTPLELATAHGTDAGKAAASWVFDGNTTRETYQQFLAYVDDGDPRIDQFAPAAGWLSGEWADTTLPADLIQMCEIPTDDEGNVISEALWDECQTAYEEAADAAYWAELERVARLQIEP